MYFSVALLALAAGVHAAPTGENPLNQIGDGQIQAPAGTASVVSQVTGGQGQGPRSTVETLPAPVPTTVVETHPTPAPTTETHPVSLTETVMSQPTPEVETITSTDITTVTSCFTSGSVETHPAPTTPVATETHPMTPMKPATPTPTPSSICPIDLPPDFQYPHGISNGGSNSFSARITPSTPTTFTFDIPASYAGKTCNHVFSLPAHGTMQTSGYTLSGSGELEFSTEGMHLGSFMPTENSKFEFRKPCLAGKSESVEVKSTGVGLSFFEDYNPCPVGLFIVPE